MIRLNYWFDTTNISVKTKVSLPYHADVVVVGGGFAGLTTLYFLLESGINAILLEKAEIGFRASGRSNGYSSFSEQDDTSFSVLNNTLIKQIIKTEDINCGLNCAGELLLYIGKPGKQHTFHRVESKKIGDLIPSSSFKTCFYNPNALAFNVYEFLCNLALACEVYGDTIFNNFDVLKFKKVGKNTLLTLSDGQEITCKYLVLCNNNFHRYINSAYLVKNKIHAGCTKKLSDTNIAMMPPMSLHLGEDKLRCRLCDERLFIESEDELPYQYDKLCKYFSFLSAYPIDYAWGDSVIGTVDGNPIIDEVRKNVFVNGMFGRHGLSYGCLGGKAVADLIMGQKPICDMKPFSYKRFKKG